MGIRDRLDHFSSACYSIGHKHWGDWGHQTKRRCILSLHSCPTCSKVLMLLILLEGLLDHYLSAVKYFAMVSLEWGSFAALSYTGRGLIQHADSSISWPRLNTLISRKPSWQSQHCRLRSLTPFHFIRNRIRRRIEFDLYSFAVVFHSIDLSRSPQSNAITNSTLVCPFAHSLCCYLVDVCNSGAQETLMWS